MVLLARDTEVNRAEYDWDLSKWAPLVQEKEFVPWLVKKGNPVTPAGELYDQLVQTSDHIAATAHGLEYIPAGMRMTV